MAFVSDEKRLVFIHITKTAGTSICQHLSSADGLDLTGGREYDLSGVGNDIHPQFRPGGINVHDTFDEVRKKYKHCHDYHFFSVVRNPWARVFSYYQHKFRRGDKDMPLGTFAEVMSKSRVLLLEPQFYWCRGVDRLIHFENLHEEYAQLCADFDLKGELPHLNKSHHADYRRHYDDYSRKLVGEYYRYEIEQLGYRF